MTSLLDQLDERDRVPLARLWARLRDVAGIGPVIAGRLLGRARSASAFANYAGVAPIEVASGDHVRHRLPRGGDRQLNLALHIVVLTQVRMRESIGRAYYDTKIVAGKSHTEAMRCLKRRLAERFWRLMLSDDHRLAAGWRGEGGDVAGAVTEFERLLTDRIRVRRGSSRHANHPEQPRLLARGG